MQSPICVQVETSKHAYPPARCFPAAAAADAAAARSPGDGDDDARGMSVREGRESEAGERFVVRVKRMCFFLPLQMLMQNMQYMRVKKKGKDATHEQHEYCERGGGKDPGAGEIPGHKYTNAQVAGGRRRRTSERTTGA